MPENPSSARQKRWLVGTGLLLGIATVVAARGTLSYTSTDAFCTQACHAHPHATDQWLLSAHYANKRGIVTHCTDCHLPPGGIRYLTEKARLGAHDAYGQIFKDVTKIDWAREQKINQAVTFTYDESCIHCHSNLFGQGLSQVVGALPAALQETDAHQVREMKLVARRMEAHLYYQRNRDRLHCVNCHLFEGHSQQKKLLLSEIAVAETPEFPLGPSGFQNYTEAVPGSNLKFHMIAVPAGTVEMGSPELGTCRQRDTGPAHAVSLNAFWMAQAGVTGSNLAWFESQHKLQVKSSKDPRSDDPTASTQQVASAYTEWLSRVTGKKYRLPTEAELEYACIADGSMPSWNEPDSRAHLENNAAANAWGFAGLPDAGTELSLDYPQISHGAPSDDTGITFRVVRESDQAKSTSSASASSLRH